MFTPKPHWHIPWRERIRQEEIKFFKGLNHKVSPSSLLKNLQSLDKNKIGHSVETDELLDKYIKSKIGVGEDKGNGKILTHY